MSNSVVGGNTALEVRKTNHRIRVLAGHKGHLMRVYPSILEWQIKNLLDENAVRYDFHRVFYKMSNDTAKKKVILKYYIADFWLPDKKIVLKIGDSPRKIEVESDDYMAPSLEGFRLQHTTIDIDSKDLHSENFLCDFTRLVK